MSVRGPVALALAGALGLGLAAVLTVTGTPTGQQVRAASFGPVEREQPHRAPVTDVARPESSAPAAASGQSSVGWVPSAIALPDRPAAPVVPVGVAPDGGLQVPDDPSVVGWWAGGSEPGDLTGPVVLVGHIDSATRGLGLFAQLLDLRAGQAVTLAGPSGRSLTYVVTERQAVAKAALPADLFVPNSPPRLVLITCGGTFDRVQHYSDNIIVAAEPTP